MRTQVVQLKAHVQLVRGGLIACPFTERGYKPGRRTVVPLMLCRLRQRRPRITEPDYECTRKSVSILPVNPRSAKLEVRGADLPLNLSSGDCWSVCAAMLATQHRRTRRSATVRGQISGASRHLRRLRVQVSLRSLILGSIVAACAIPRGVTAADRIIDHNFHGWYSYFGDHPLGDSRWGVHLEGQYRRHDLITQGQQLLLRPGVNYQLNKYVLLTGGYAFVRSSRYGEFATPGPAGTEHRIWQQAWFRYRFGPVSWTTRLRFENRFIGGLATRPDTSKYSFEQRFRAWQQIRIPASSSTYFTAYNELWFYVKPYQSKSAFDQNRAYAAIGCQLNPSLRLELGYMNQSLLIRSGVRLETNHTITVSLFGTGNLLRR